MNQPHLNIILLADRLNFFCAKICYFLNIWNKQFYLKIKSLATKKLNIKIRVLFYHVNTPFTINFLTDRAMKTNLGPSLKEIHFLPVSQFHQRPRNKLFCKIVKLNWITSYFIPVQNGSRLRCLINHNFSINKVWIHHNKFLMINFWNLNPDVT